MHHDVWYHTLAQLIPKKPKMNKENQFRTMGLFPISRKLFSKVLLYCVLSIKLSSLVTLTSMHSVEGFRLPRSYLFFDFLLSMARHGSVISTFTAPTS